MNIGRDRKCRDALDHSDRLRRHRRAGISDQVHGWLALPDGTVGDVTVAQSLDAVHGLDDQALKAMKQWRFKPGLKNGEPVAVLAVGGMTFTLK
jgi:TonB family protein